VLPACYYVVGGGLYTLIGQLLALEPQRQDVKTEVVARGVEIAGPVELLAVHPGGEHSQGRLVGVFKGRLLGLGLRSLAQEFLEIGRLGHEDFGLERDGFVVFTGVEGGCVGAVLGGGLDEALCWCQPCSTAGGEHRCGRWQLTGAIGAAAPVLTLESELRRERGVTGARSFSCSMALWPRLDEDPARLMVLVRTTGTLRAMIASMCLLR